MNNKDTLGQEIEKSKKKIIPISRKYQRKKKNLYKLFIKVILWTSIILFTLFIVLRLFPIIRVNKITVIGLNSYDKKDVIKMSGVSNSSNAMYLFGNNLFDLISLRCKKVENNLTEKCPYITKVSAKYSIFNGLQIKINESSPIGILNKFNNDIIIDEKFNVVDITEDKNKYKLPLLKGINFSEYELAKKLKTEDLVKLQKYLSLFNKIKEIDTTSNKKMFDLIKQVDIRDKGVFYLSISNYINVIMNDNEKLTYNLSVVSKYFEIYKEDDGLYTIDFTIGKDPLIIPLKNIVSNDSLGG